MTVETRLLVWLKDGLGMCRRSTAMRLSAVLSSTTTASAFSVSRLSVSCCTAAPPRRSSRSDWGTRCARAATALWGLPSLQLQAACQSGPLLLLRQRGWQHISYKDRSGIFFIVGSVCIAHSQMVAFPRLNEQDHLPQRTLPSAASAADKQTACA